MNQTHIKSTVEHAMERAATQEVKRDSNWISLDASTSVVANGVASQAPVWFAFFGVNLRKFWNSSAALMSFLGVIVVALAVVLGLMLSGIIGVPVALSLFSGLVGGWFGSASGASLSAHGWRGAVINVICSLTVFFALSGVVHLIASRNHSPAQNAVAVSAKMSELRQDVMNSRTVMTKIISSFVPD